MSRAAIVFVISAGILLCSLALWLKKSWDPPKESDSIAPFYFFMGGVFISAALLFLPLYHRQYLALPNAWIHSAVSAVHHAIQLFTVDADRDMIAFCYEAFEGRLAKCYALLLSAEYILAPVLAAGFIVTFFKNTTSYLKYTVLRYTQTHVFSELNEKSIALAKSIKAGHKWATIVFTDVFAKNEEVSFELLREAKKLRAICFKKDILAVRFIRKPTARGLSFYVIGEDETENINHAIALARKYSSAEHCRLYVFTTRDECEYLINQRGETERQGARGIKIRRIHEISSLIYHNLYQRGYEKLYLSAQALHGAMKAPPQRITITAVIVGVGLHGAEMIKALAWYCQMEGYQLRVEAFDKDPLAEKRFAAACPELMRKINRENSSDDAICQISIHAGIDVTTEAFVNSVKELKEATYVLVSLGADVLNIRTAIKVRSYFAQAGVTRVERVAGQDRGPLPVIQAIVYKAYETDKLGKLINYRHQYYSIDFIGDVASTYTEAVIMNSQLEKNAEAIHTLYYSPDTFYEYEYYYRSSCAAAIHIRAIASELSRHPLLQDPIDPGWLEWTDLFLKVIYHFAFKAKADDFACYCRDGQQYRSRQRPEAEIFSWAQAVLEHIIDPILGRMDAFAWDTWSAGTLITEDRAAYDRLVKLWRSDRSALEGIISALRAEDPLYPADPYSGIDPEKLSAVTLPDGREITGIDGRFLRDHILSCMSEKPEEIKYALHYILLVEKLKEQEHRRWNAYMRSEGYIESDSRFDLGKMHTDLRPYSQIKPEEKNKDIHMHMIVEQLKTIYAEKNNKPTA